MTGTSASTYSTVLDAHTSESDSLGPDRFGQDTGLNISYPSCSAPADYAAINGTFTSCASDNQMFPGVYIDEAGQTVT